MKLIDGARDAWRLWSVRLAALGAFLTVLAAAAPDTLLTVWGALPSEIRDAIPIAVNRWIEAALFVAVLVARVVKQRGAPDGE